MVPPTPGPLAATGILGADLGLVIVIGLIFTVILLPVVIVYAKWVGPTLEDQIIPEVREAVYGRLTPVGASTDSGSGSGSRSSLPDAPASGGHVSDEIGEIATYNPNDYLGEPPAGTSHRHVGALLGSLPLAIPLVLIVLNTVTAAVDRDQQGALSGDYEPSSWTTPFAFFGNPVVALVIGAILAVYVLLPRWTPRNKVCLLYTSDAADE